MVILIFALGYFFLKLIAEVAAPPYRSVLTVTTCIVAIVLLFIFGVGPIHVG